MSNPFKIGDQIEYRKDKGYPNRLTLGKIYTVKDINDIFVIITDDTGYTGQWASTYFDYSLLTISPGMIDYSNYNPVSLTE